LKEIYAALLLHHAGKEINEENMEKIMKSIGDLTDDDKVRIKMVVSSLKNVNIDQVLKEATVVQTATPAAAAVAEKKEEKKEEKKGEEEGAAGLAALFG